MKKKFFLITVDTEGDNLWSRPTRITTKNAEFIPRFQQTCEKYGLKPTYLTNYEMANSEFFREFASDCLNKGTCEIGLHVHAWNTPPEYNLTGDDMKHLPYLFEYPFHIMKEKILYLHNLLWEIFETQPRSHRAGRWGLTNNYAVILDELDYLIDCSVTPHVSWKSEKGDPQGQGGPDYRGFPSHPYFINLNNIKENGNTSLLEIPVTIIKRPNLMSGISDGLLQFLPLAGRIFKKLFPDIFWFRPGKTALNDMLIILNECVNRDTGYVELMIHSSELMPGGSPTFPEPKDIEKLYDSLHILFEKARNMGFIGATLMEFREIFMGEE